MNLETLVKQVEDYFGLKVNLAKENIEECGLHKKVGLINFPSGKIFTKIYFISLNGYDWGVQQTGTLSELYFVNLVNRKLDYDYWILNLRKRTASERQTVSNKI